MPDDQEGTKAGKQTDAEGGDLADQVFDMVAE